MRERLGQVVIAGVIFAILRLLEDHFYQRETYIVTLVIIPAVKAVIFVWFMQKAKNFWEKWDKKS